MIGISALFLLISVLVISIIFIYWLIYAHKINQRILSGENQGRKLIDIPKMIMIAILVGLVVFCSILMWIVNDKSIQTYTVSRNNYAIIDVSNPDNYEYITYMGDMEFNDASYAKVYNMEENPGYSREVVESGDYVFTVFRRTSIADSFHPDFLCYAQYVGDDMEEMSCYMEAEFTQLGAESSAFSLGSGGYINECLLYIGYLDAGWQFDISMSLLDSDAEVKYDEAVQQGYKEDKGEFPKVKEFATEVSEVSIVID